MGQVKKLLTFVVFALLLSAPYAHAGDGSFTQADRDRLVRVETKLEMLEKTTDKRITELREDMNKRFEQVDKRFEQVDKKFEQVDKRFEEIITFIGILAAIFTSMTIATIGFAYWDRKTMVQKAKDETIAEIEKDGKVIHLVGTLRELAKNDSEVAKVLRQFNLL
ncbi:MAG: hypothetical protein HY280_02775 [Nitrospinae bacterium]|nr:hypothetical protein [Nitrospinota bacterium]